MCAGSIRVSLLPAVALSHPVTNHRPPPLQKLNPTSASRPLASPARQYHHMPPPPGPQFPRNPCSRGIVSQYQLALLLLKTYSTLPRKINRPSASSLSLFLLPAFLRALTRHGIQSPLQEFHHPRLIHAVHQPTQPTARQHPRRHQSCPIPLRPPDSFTPANPRPVPPVSLFK